MKILFVSTVHPSPTLPTMGTFNRVLLQSLRDEGHEVRAVVPIGWPQAGWSAVREAPDVEVFRWWYIPGVKRGRMHTSLSRQLHSFWRRRASGWAPEVVVGYWVHPDGTAALDLADSLGVPGVLMVGGTDINELAHTSTRHAIIRSTLKRASAIIAIGNALARRVEELGVEPQRVHVFQRGVDRSRFFPGDRAAARRRLRIPGTAPVLLWVGRMVAVKGLDTLLEGFAMIGRSEPPHLYLVGRGPLEPAIRKQAARLGLKERVHFVGLVAHDLLPDWYRAADMVVLPSRSEGTPNVLLEALACGTPFVASNVGSIPELAESPSWLVPPGDPTLLAGKVVALLGSRTQSTVSRTDDRGAARQFAGVLTETVASFAINADRPSG